LKRTLLGVKRTGIKLFEVKSKRMKISKDITFCIRDQQVNLLSESNQKKLK